MLFYLDNRDRNPIHPRKPKKVTSSIGSKNQYYYKEYGLDGSIEYVFLQDLIDIFDRVFINNNEKYASLEQRKLLKSYCKEADTGLLSELNQQLDNYLGGYLGEMNDVYFTK